MAKYFGETESGSCTAFIKESPDTGGVAIDAKIEGEFVPSTDTWLEDIRVFPEAQGKGEGTILIEGLEAAARGCRRIIGTFEPLNLGAAAKMYKDHGYYLKRSKREPSIVYVIKDLEV